MTKDLCFVDTLVSVKYKTLKTLLLCLYKIYIFYAKLLTLETVPEDDCSKGAATADDDDCDCRTIGDGGGSHGSAGSLTHSFPDSKST